VAAADALELPADQGHHEEPPLIACADALALAELPVEAPSSCGPNLRLCCPLGPSGLQSFHAAPGKAAEGVAPGQAAGETTCMKRSGGRQDLSLNPKHVSRAETTHHAVRFEVGWSAVSGTSNAPSQNVATHTGSCTLAILSSYRSYQQ
jgi:hypothetical protein